jgi:hypothetical protein
MKYCHPKLTSAGIIAGDVGRLQQQLIDSFSLWQLSDVFLYAREDDAIVPLHHAI